MQLHHQSLLAAREKQGLTTARASFAAALLWLHLRCCVLEAPPRITAADVQVLPIRDAAGIIGL